MTGDTARRLVAAFLATVSGLPSAWTTASAAQRPACDSVKEPEIAEAVAEARTYLATAWLRIGENYYIAFSTKAAKANPFDLAARGTAAATSTGYIWIGGLTCSVVAGAHREPKVLRFGANAMSFSENGAAWTKPFAAPRLIEIKLARNGAGWTATEHRDEETVLLPDDQLRRPKPEEIPAPSTTLRIPCGENKRWAGRKCEPLRAAAQKKRGTP
jgi:hypothetical protein